MYNKVLGTITNNSMLKNIILENFKLNKKYWIKDINEEVITEIIQSRRDPIFKYDQDTEFDTTQANAGNIIKEALKMIAKIKFIKYNKTENLVCVIEES